MKFEIGDRVELIERMDSDGKVGMRGTVKGENSGATAVEFDDFTDGHSCGGLCKERSGYNCDEDKLIKISKSGRKVKAVKVDKHLVLQDDCNNVVKVAYSYDEVITQKPSGNETLTIYKLVPVAKIENTTKVTKIIESKPKKKK